MNQLYELVRKLSPTGVHFCSLEDVCRIETGKQINKGNLLSEGNYPVLNGGISPSGYWHEYNTDSNTIAISQGGASAGYVNYITTPFWAGAHCYVVFLKTEKVLYKFLYYFIKNNQEKLMNSKQGAGIPGLNRKDIYSLNIPLPPLPIQQEIVRILDTFTNLTAELTAELTARRKQYEYYRDELLTFGEDVDYKTLPEISVNCDRQRKPVTKGKRNSGSYPYYGASGIADYVSDYIFEGDYLLISEDGANLLARSTPIAFSISGKNWVNNHAHVLKFETDVMRKYVEIYLNSIGLERYISGGAQPKLNQDNLNKIPIPVPENHRIQTIVDILTKFDKLCNDLGAGIPAEVSARQKQYEYYRGKLLRFS